MKVIIAGGGTGGHVFPAISIAEEILARSSKNEVLFVGTEKGFEKKLLPLKGYKIEYITSGGLIGKNPVEQAKGLYFAFKGVFSSIKILKEFKPDVVIGVGGYASGPTVLSAFLSFIPTAVCEQNSIPGFTNRLLSRFVKRVFITFENSKKYFPERKTFLTGNPIRKDLTAASKIDQKDRNIINILILGGSQGSKKLNEDIPGCFSKINNKKIIITHQTGEKDYNMVKNTYCKSDIDANVYKFIDNMKEVYDKTDLIICRSGAGTISEITAMGIPSILVPFSHAAHDHQLLNAMFLEKKGAAIIIEENNLNSEALTRALNKIFNNNNIKKMSEISKALGKPQAASEIVNHIEMIIRKN
ncbi:MAG: undecaprenyldiphospho-muramoylpentapeptide beta-N-acetylglucosaminyltransferase [Thermodesulfobacteriota bacterium]